MDLTPFFQNVERIATALELIARNTEKPFIHNVSNITQFDVEELMTSLHPQPLPPFDQAVLDRAMDLDPEVLFGSPAPAPQPVEEPVVFKPLDEVIKGIYDGGTHSANGIAHRLNEMGRVTEKGRRFNNVNVKPLMARIGLQSPYDTKPKVEPKPEAPAEPAPEPAPARKPVVPGVNHFRERNQKVEKDHMDMRRQLSPGTRGRLEAFEAARAEGKSISDAELIAKAVADGMVTQCPPCVDSDGFDHLNSSAACTMSSARLASSAFGGESGGRAAVRGGSK